MLFGVLSGSCQPFFTVRRHQTDGQAGLVHHIGHTALSGAALQLAQQRTLVAELGQPALQIGVEGVDTGEMCIRDSPYPANIRGLEKGFQPVTTVFMISLMLCSCQRFGSSKAVSYTHLDVYKRQLSKRSPVMRPTAKDS